MTHSDKFPPQCGLVGWIYLSNYIPNPEIDDGFRFTRDQRVAENNAVQGTIRPVFTHDEDQ